MTHQRREIRLSLFVCQAVFAPHTPAGPLSSAREGPPSSASRPCSRPFSAPRSDWAPLPEEGGGAFTRRSHVAFRAKGGGRAGTGASPLFARAPRDRGAPADAGRRFCVAGIELHARFGAISRAGGWAPGGGVRTEGGGILCPTRRVFLRPPPPPLFGVQPVPNSPILDTRSAPRRCAPFALPRRTPGGGGPGEGQARPVVVRGRSPRSPLVASRTRTRGSARKGGRPCLPSLHRAPCPSPTRREQLASRFPRGRAYAMQLVQEAGREEQGRHAVRGGGPDGGGGAFQKKTFPPASARHRPLCLQHVTVAIKGGPRLAQGAHHRPPSPPPRPQYDHACTSS